MDVNNCPHENAVAVKPRRARSPLATRVRREFCAFVRHASFPCLGAKAALNTQSIVLKTYGELASSHVSKNLARDLAAFVAAQLPVPDQFASFVAIFRRSAKTEAEFEKAFWLQLQKLNQIDAAQGNEWDSSVESDPADPRFSFSFAGRALYVIGLHPQSSRAARRFKWPALVFNPHEQFERLRAEGKWRRMQQMIRNRDIQLQGNINPMLSDFGEMSEARQYSGRAVEEKWRAPFVAQSPKGSGVCPFAAHKHES